MSQTKVVIIGAGPAGYPAACRAARLGAAVTLIEKSRAGGTCLNMGCIPSKIMRRAADFMRAAAASPAYGVNLGQPELDLPALRARQQDIVANLVAGLTDQFQGLSIRLVQAEARVERAGQVAAITPDGATEHIPYDHLIVATGSAPASLPGLPMDGQRVISSDQALWLDQLPESLLVVGGGVLGCELAQIYHDFGVKVAIVEAMPRLLPIPGLDEEISKTYLRGLKKIKLPVYLNHTLSKLEPTNQAVSVTLTPASGPGEDKQLQFEKILMAVGRKPAHQDLGLAALGVAFDPKGWIVAGPDFQTSVPRVWAIGDCLGPARPMLAHLATAEGLACVDNIMGRPRPAPNPEHVPAAIFTRPEIGTVGLTLAQAQQREPNSRASDFQFRALGKAQAIGQIDGLVRLVVGPDNRLLGGHIIGPEAGDLIAELTLAITAGLTVNDLAKTIHSHPTLAEAIWEASI